MNKYISILLLVIVTSLYPFLLQAQMSFGFTFNSNAKDTVIVTEVFEKGPAAKAGLQVGDMLQTINSIKLTQNKLADVLSIFKAQPNSQNKINLLRSGKAITFVIDKAETSTFDFTCLSGDCSEGACEIRFISGFTAKGNCKNGKLNGQAVYKDKYGTIRYTGNVVNNRYQGQGEYNTPDSSRYIGNFLDGRFNGKGVYQFKNGNSYDGDWVLGNKQGIGTLFINDGRKYTGDWKADKKNGSGIFTWPNGAKYEGQWVNDKREGIGTHFYSTGEIYKGDWKDDKKNGSGIYTWTNGAKYEGQWVNDKREGVGTNLNSTGEIYKGDWKDDKKHGKGIYTWTTGEKYEGQWVNDKREGVGNDFYSTGEIYKGDWKDDKKNGSGIYTWTTGEKYEGQWVNGKREGVGNMLYSNGGTYKGGWKEDKESGKGSHYRPNGKIGHNGLYNNGMRHGNGEYYYEDGRVFTGEHRNDTLYFGTLTLLNKTTYSGYFIDGKAGGKGKSTYLDGSAIEGDFLDGKPVYGTVTYKDGKKITGKFSNHKPTGTVTIVHTNGKKETKVYTEENNSNTSTTNNNSGENNNTNSLTYSYQKFCSSLQHILKQRATDFAAIKGPLDEFESLRTDEEDVYEVKYYLEGAKEGTLSITKDEEELMPAVLSYSYTEKGVSKSEGEKMVKKLIADIQQCMGAKYQLKKTILNDISTYYEFFEKGETSSYIKVQQMSIGQLTYVSVIIES